MLDGSGQIRRRRQRYRMREFVDLSRSASSAWNFRARESADGRPEVEITDGARRQQARRVKTSLAAALEERACVA